MFTCGPALMGGAATPPDTDLFREDASGAAANFVGRVPARGGAYDCDPDYSGGGSLADLSVNGAGLIRFVDSVGAAVPRSAFTRVVGAYAMELKFSMDPASTDSSITLVANNVSSDHRLIQADIFDGGAGINLTLALQDDDHVGGSGDSPDPAPLTPTGAEQTLLIEVRPGIGTVAKLDGATLITSAFTPDINPDAVYFYLSGTSSGGISKARLYPLS